MKTVYIELLGNLTAERVLYSDVIPSTGDLTTVRSSWFGEGKINKECVNLAPDIMIQLILDFKSELKLSESDVIMMKMSSDCSFIEPFRIMVKENERD